MEQTTTPDETTEHEHFYLIINKHLHVLANFLLSFGRGGAFQNRQLDGLVKQAHSIIMQPTTYAAVIFLIASLIIMHTSHYWLHTFARRLPFKLISRRVLVNGSPRNGSTNHLEGSEFHCHDAGIFAIQGRRPRMEDKFTIVLPASNRFSFNSNPKAVGHQVHNQDLDIEIFSIFDGHGGDVGNLFCCYFHLFLLLPTFSACGRPSFSVLSALLYFPVCVSAFLFVGRLKTTFRTSGCANFSVQHTVSLPNHSRNSVCSIQKSDDLDDGII